MTTHAPADLAKAYDPAEVEPQMARRWDAADAFAADPGTPGAPGQDGPAYAIVIPPPNVTAALHMGHALNNTLQDILIRWRRMCGDNTLWMPGTDHAGIATQTVVDKRLQAEGQPALKDYKRDEAEGRGGREQFVAKVQAWKDEYEAQITNQLKAMGCSCDWTRQRFTMDDMCARAVREAFFRLFRDGLIYRGKRLVNWDPMTQTALADDEVEMRDIDGHFYYLQYPLEDGRGHVTVATTRPETMLGDTAVAVNPNDLRAGELRGRKVRLPIVSRIVPIIEDEYVVLADPDSSDEKAKYSSGFLKVTPAHDPNDYEIGERFGLPMINVMAPDGTISDQHGWDDVSEEVRSLKLLGMDRYEAREAVVDWFRQNNLLEDVKPYRHAVGHSYRSHVAIEPYLSDQWYVKVTDDRLAAAALRAMAHDQRDEGKTRGGDDSQPWEGQLRFTPARYARTFQTWHENIRDWCISRQLWWGHRIPVWHKRITVDQDSWCIQDEFQGGGLDHVINGEYAAAAIVMATTDGERVDPKSVLNVRPEQPAEYDTYVCYLDDHDGHVLEKFGFTQDPDVLDTWFSSALWPFSTLGWPEDTPELARWNPSNVLCTAREIITLWVSRMVMMNLYLLGRLPFTDVFIHAMIQDGQGRKMSKSLGNGVDPLDIIHSHGSDAMRYTLASMTTQTQDVRMPVTRNVETGRNTSEKFDIGRNFSNKMWNAARFALSNLEAAGPGHDDALTLADRWILTRLAAAVRAADAALTNFDFSQYAQGLYDFFWRDFCDWYIEAVKPTVKQNAAQQQVLATCLDVALRLLHPAMPFITEKLWQRLNEVWPNRGGNGVTCGASELLVRAPWPQVDEHAADADAESHFELVRNAVSAIRTARTDHKVPPRQNLDISIKTDKQTAGVLSQQRQLIDTLAATVTGEVGPHVQRPDNAAATSAGPVEIYLHDMVDADAERQRLTKRSEELQAAIGRLRGRLSNPSYVDKAPAKLVQQTHDELAEAEREAETVARQLSELK